MNGEQLPFDLDDHVSNYAGELGRSAREAGISRATSVRDPWTVAWVDRAEAAIRRLAARGEPFNADDVRDLAGEPPSEALVGSVLRSSGRAGLIRKTGEVVESRRPSRHRGAIRLWIGAT